MSKKKINKTKINLYQEKNSTSLVGIIGVFMILVSMIGNTNSQKSGMLKANLLESTRTSQNNIINIGKQTVFIGGKAYVIEITPKN